MDGSENSLTISCYIGLSLDSCKCVIYSKIKIRLKNYQQQEMSNSLLDV